MDKTLFDDRKRRILMAAKRAIPDRVPVCALMETYALAYAGTTIEACNKSMKHHIHSYGKIYEDIYFDAAFVQLMTHSLELSTTLGSDAFFASEDGVTMQHKEVCPMVPEDYDMLIKNPLDFIYNVFLPKKFTGFSGSPEQQVDAFKKSLRPMAEYLMTAVYGSYYFKHNLSLPVVVGGTAEMPLDFVFDFFRGFRDTIMDIRRHPDKVKAAADALLPLTVDLAKSTSFTLSMPPALKEIPWALKFAFNSMLLGKEPQYKDFPWIFNPCHIPPFLNEKQFREFYWPTFLQVAQHIKDCGGHMLTVLEGKWGPNLDLLTDLPANCITVIVENDDVVEVKKKLGHKVSVMGGMPIDKLRNGTRDECIDYAKYLIQECAPGGGYIFSTDKVLLAPGDVNPDNLRAVNEFVHEYGIYR